MDHARNHRHRVRQSGRTDYERQAGRARTHRRRISRCTAVELLTAQLVLLCVGAGGAGARTLRDAGVVDFAADDRVAIALLKSLQTLSAAGRRLWAGRGSQECCQTDYKCSYDQHSIT